MSLSHLLPAWSALGSMLAPELANAQKLWYFKIFPQVCGGDSLHICLMKRIVKNLCLEYSGWGRERGGGMDFFYKTEAI